MIAINVGSEEISAHINVGVTIVNQYIHHYNLEAILSNTLDTPDQRKSELRGDTKTTDTMTDVSENNEGVNVSPRNNFSSQLMEIIDYHFSRYVEDDFKPDQKVQVNNIIELYHSLLKFANDPDVFICPINKYFRPCGYRVEKEKLI